MVLFYLVGETKAQKVKVSCPHHTAGPALSARPCDFPNRLSLETKGHNWVSCSS